MVLDYDLFLLALHEIQEIVDLVVHVSIGTVMRYKFNVEIPSDVPLFPVFVDVVEDVLMQ